MGFQAKAMIYNPLYDNIVYIHNNRLDLPAPPVLRRPAVREYQNRSLVMASCHFCINFTIRPPNESSFLSNGQWRHANLSPTYRECMPSFERWSISIFHRLQYMLQFGV